MNNNMIFNIIDELEFSKKSQIIRNTKEITDDDKVDKNPNSQKYDQKIDESEKIN